MKTTKLFFALAIAASLVACTKEVIVEPEKVVESFDEIKGAKLLATGFAIDPTYEGEALTKIGTDGTNVYWEKGEEIGVAWFVGGAVADDQGTYKKNLSGVSNIAYANHKLINDGSDFKSNSNVYEGWHIAYHPYVQTPKPQQLTKIAVNPTMAKAVADTKVAYGVEQLENMPKFSIAQFVDEKDVVDGVIQNKKFAIEGIANTVRPKFTVAEDVLAEDALSNLKIKSIQLSAGGANKIFLNELAVDPKYFPVKAVEDKLFFNETHFGESGTAFTGVYVNNVTTTLAEPCSLNSENLNFRAFIAPVKGGTPIALNAVSVKVALEGGSSFTIRYNSTAGEDDVNNKAIKRFVELLNGTFEANGQTYSLQKLNETAFSLPFELRKADLTIAYTVDTYDAWKTCVDLATAMGKEEVTFKLTPGSEIEFPAGDMYVKDLAITATPAKSGDAPKLVFNEATNWSSQITPSGNVTISVGAEGELTLNSRLVARRINNSGKMILLDGNDMKATSEITNNGTIQVSVGSEFEGSTVVGDGKVEYTVDGPETLADIDDLVANASLNTLVVAKDLTFETVVSFPGVTVELNGAAITANAGLSAAGLKALSGENTFSGNITAPMTVAEGATLTVDGNITGNLTNDGELIINTTEVVEGARLVIDGNIDNNGTLTVNGGADVYVNKLDFTHATSSTVNVCTLYYYNDYAQGGMTQGSIKPAAVPSTPGYELINGIYFIKSSVGFANVMALADVEDYKLVLENDVEVTDNGASYILGGAAAETIAIEGNGYTITFIQVDADRNPIKTTNNATLAITNANLAHAGVGVGADVAYYARALYFDCPVDFTNVNSNKSILVAQNSTFTDVVVSDETDNYGLWIKPYGQKVTLEECTFNMVNGRGIKIEEINADALRIDAAEDKTELTISETTFVTKKKSAVLVHAKKGAVINWGSGNDISKVEADSVNAVWIDDAMNHTDYLLNVKVNGDATVVVEGQ